MDSIRFNRANLTEGLLGIALRCYGDANRWPLLYEANRAVIGDNPSCLRPGQQLVLPDFIPDRPLDHPKRIYCVVVRDLAEGLPGIALRFCGKAERWRELYALNRGVIGDDPHELVPGQWLVLPV